MELPLSQRIAEEVGIRPEHVRECVTAAFRELHRTALVGDKSTTSAVLESYLAFGAQACYHFGGILIEACKGDEASSYSELLERLMGHEGLEYRPLLEEWLRSDKAVRDSSLDPDGDG